MRDAKSRTKGTRQFRKQSHQTDDATTANEGIRYAAVQIERASNPAKSSRATLISRGWGTPWVSVLGAPRAARLQGRRLTRMAKQRSRSSDPEPGKNRPGRAPRSSVAVLGSSGSRRPWASAPSSDTARTVTDAL
ncbi:hypothetical protein MRX96_010609 [Rhipicephalus microplus]